MGYPMSYRRFLDRARLFGSYQGPTDDEPQAPNSVHVPAGYQWEDAYWTRWEGFDLGRQMNMFRGDLRRLENDQRDERHLAEYAKRAGVTPEQARAVLDALFEGSF